MNTAPIADKKLRYYKPTEEEHQHNLHLIDSYPDYDWQYLANVLEQYISVAGKIVAGQNIPSLRRDITRFGICEVIHVNTLCKFNLINNLYSLWPLHSGVNAFPVPSNIKKYGCSPITTFAMSAQEGNMLKGQYGRDRIRLAKYMYNRTRQILRQLATPEAAKENN